MYDYGARNYDPALGRWMNIDPLAEMYESWSGYNYVLNNPIVHVDPDGRSVDNEYNINVTTGKTELVSTKGGDKTDYINVYVGDKKPSKIYSETVAVQRTTENIKSNTSEVGQSYTSRLPGEIRTTNILPKSGALEDPSAGLFAGWAGGKIAGALLGAVIGKVSSLLGTEATAATEVATTSETSALSAGDALRIENAATRIQKPISVVGSRARGTAGANSDWDYAIEGLNSRGWDKIKNSIPGAKSTIDNTRRNIDIFNKLDPTKPHITINPRP